MTNNIQHRKHIFLNYKCRIKNYIKLKLLFTYNTATIQEKGLTTSKISKSNMEAFLYITDRDY